MYFILNLCIKNSNSNDCQKKIETCVSLLNKFLTEKRKKGAKLMGQNKIFFFYRNENEGEGEDGNSGYVLPKDMQANPSREWGKWREKSNTSKSVKYAKSDCGLESDVSNSGWKDGGGKVGGKVVASVLV